MKYYSTNKKVESVSFKEAIFKGLPDDNGLYMPESIPVLSASFFEKLPHLSLAEIGFEVSKAFIGDEIPHDKLKEIVADAINFEAPLVEIAPNLYSLELFHGPTLAFKDFGARFMSRVMSFFLEQKNEVINILVATSGDTGSAVAQGFLQVPGIKVTILYPKGKVSLVQEQQLTTIGHNITAVEIDGNFDDCQRLVKLAFLDKSLNEKIKLSSANSINIARLIPQSFYYFHAIGQLKSKNSVVFCTPSGNFGNLCGGLIASKMGLPISKFIAATNSNNIVPHFLATGNFEPKPSIPTWANAMDVGNPSNFPRIEALFNNDFEAITKKIDGVAYTDDEILQSMKDAQSNSDYGVCPHSAIGFKATKAYISEHKNVTGVFLATAHPAKFGDVVEKATGIAPTLPASLAQVMQKKKNATSLGTDFETFKNFLLA